MKTLYFLRHAEAGFSSDVDDIDRPLTEKGIRDAERLGQIMTKKKYTPDFIYCSDALRTSTTLDSLSIKEARVEKDNKLYTGTSGDYIDLIQKTGSQYHNVLIIGHNPSIHETVRFLVQYQGDIRLLSYRPCTLTVMKTNISDWSELSPSYSAIHDILIPEAE